MLETILLCIVIISILLIIFTIFHNKFALAIIKIDEAEENLSILLDKKNDLLERTRPIIKKELKLKDFLNQIEGIHEMGLNLFEKNDLLKKAYKEVFKKIDEHDKLLKSETLLSIIQSLNDNEEEIVASIKFYNDSVVVFNQLFTSFPSNIVGFLLRYKRKDFYNDEKREIYEIMDVK